MIIKNTKFRGLLVIKQKNYIDKRGDLRTIFNKKILRKNFVYEYSSTSKKNVLRGFHLQTRFKQTKLISVLKGKILDVVIDLRKNSKTFGKYYSLIISDKSEYSFYVPEGFAHGFLCLSDKCIVHYKCSEYRHKKSETTLHWGDKTVKIKWPIKKPILSKKDKIGKNLEFFR